MIHAQQVHAGCMVSGRVAASCPQAAVKHVACLRRGVLTCTACSSAAALPTPDQSGRVATPQGTVFERQQQQQPLQLTRSIRSCGSYTELLAIVLQHADALSAVNVTQLLHRAAMIARADMLQDNQAGNCRSKAKITAWKAPATAGSEVADAGSVQQLVSSCLAMLLEANDQVGPYELSSCMLSLAVLCGSKGPAAGAIISSSSAVMPAGQRSSHASSAAGSKAVSKRSSSRQQQEQEQELLLLHHQQASGGGSVVLQQLITPASNRALEQLMLATAPQLQVQQLLDLAHRTVLPQAKQHQLVNVMYGMAALRLRPAPHVLQQLLLLTQHSLEGLVGPSSSSTVRRSRQASATPKALAQLLWAAAVLQLPLPAAWTAAYWAASSSLLPHFSAQDVANMTWAAASLKLQPPAAWLAAVQAQAAAVAGCMSGQGLANTLWGLAGLQPGEVSVALLLQQLKCCLTVAARLDGQNLANIAWGTARCLAAYDSSSCSGSSAVSKQDVAAVRQQLQQLLLSCQPLLPLLQPHDWANLLWACGQLQLHPGQEVLAQLWRKNPAGFSISLNPHSSKATVWSPQSLGNIMWGCARLKARPSAVWLQGFEAASIALLPDFSSQQLANTLWAFSELRYCASEAWMQQYWAHTDKLVQQLQDITAQTAAAALGSPACTHSSAGGSADVINTAEQQQQQQLEYAAQHVVMVLQAAGHLDLLPPKQWSRAAVAALAAAAAHQQHLQQPLQQQQQQEGIATLAKPVLRHKTLTTAVHAVSMLQTNQASRGNSSACNEFRVRAQQHVQQLLHQLGLMPAAAAAAVSWRTPVHLSAMDVLLLLLALPGLKLQQQNADAIAAQLLARGQQLLEEGSFSSSQLVQLASAVAALVASSAATAVMTHTTSSGLGRRAGSSKDAWSSAVDSNQMWKLVGSLSGNRNASSSSSRKVFLAALLQQLQRSCRWLTAAELTRSLFAIHKLHLVSSRSARRQQQSPAAVAAQHSAAAYASAAGAAVGQQMGHMAPHALASATGSLVRLGFCPDEAWLGSLLLHSSCQWEKCSNSDMCRLLHSLPLLLHRQQQQSPCRVSTPSSASCHHGVAGSSGPTRQLPSQHVPLQQLQHVYQWLQCWLAESEDRLTSFTPQQLNTTAAALCKLTAYLATGTTAAGSTGGAAPASALERSHMQCLKQQRHYVKMLVQPAWQQRFITATNRALQHLSATQLVALTAAAVELQLISWRDGHAWCATVAAEAAARAAATASTADTCLQKSAATSTNRQLQVHHVGLLAMYFRQLAYQVPWRYKQVLLQFVLDACCTADTGGSSSCTRGGVIRVKPSQLLQLLILLPRAGWMPDRRWGERLQASPVGQQLQQKMQKRPGAWQALWAALKLWDDHHSS